MPIKSIPCVRDLVPPLGLALAIAAGAAGHAWAQAAAPEPDVTYTSEEIAFFAADTDGDGLVSEAELARDAARGFATLDKDGSRTLKPEELGPHDAAQFKQIDTNGDTASSIIQAQVNPTNLAETDGMVIGDCTTSLDGFSFTLMQGNATLAKPGVGRAQTVTGEKAIWIYESLEAFRRTVVPTAP